MSVTWLPSDENMCTNSTPVTPEPMTTRCSGISVGGYASRVVRTRSPSTTAQSGMRGRLPVDEQHDVGLELDDARRAVSTTTSCGPFRRPVPWIMRTSWLSQQVDDVVLEARLDRLDAVAQALEVELRLARRQAHAGAGATSPIAPPVAIIALDGMQSQRWAAPPTMSRSTIVTSAPSRAAVVAAVLPAGPPPMMTKRRGMRTGYRRPVTWA